MVTAILILNYNTPSDTIACIQSIEAHNTAPVKFIIVDNGSSDKEGINRLDLFFAQSQKGYLRLTDSDTPTGFLSYFTFLVSSSNDGYARGNNKGLRLARADASIQNILVLNSDVLFSEDILSTLVRFQTGQKDCGLVTPLVMSRRGTVDHCCARKAPTNWDIILTFLLFNRNKFHLLSKMDERLKILKGHPELKTQPFFPVEMPSGACMLIDKKLFQEIDDFDPNTFLYYEELILYKKIKKAGRVNYCVPKVQCTHLGAESTAQISSTFLKKCNLDSADYYLKNYGRLSLTQSLIWGLVKGMWKMVYFRNK
jgi:hypothetical protein